MSWGKQSYWLFSATYTYSALLSRVYHKHFTILFPAGEGRDKSRVKYLEHVKRFQTRPLIYNFSLVWAACTIHTQIHISHNSFWHRHWKSISVALIGFSTLYDPVNPQGSRVHSEKTVWRSCVSLSPSQYFSPSFEVLLQHSSVYLQVPHHARFVSSSSQPVNVSLQMNVVPFLLRHLLIVNDFDCRGLDVNLSRFVSCCLLSALIFSGRLLWV